MKIFQNKLSRIFMVFITIFGIEFSEEEKSLMEQVL